MKELTKQEMLNLNGGLYDAGPNCEKEKELQASIVDWDNWHGKLSFTGLPASDYLVDVDDKQ